MFVQHNITKGMRSLQLIPGMPYRWVLYSTLFSYLLLLESIFHKHSIKLYSYADDIHLYVTQHYLHLLDIFAYSKYYQNRLIPFHCFAYVFNWVKKLFNGNHIVLHCLNWKKKGITAPQIYLLINSWASKPVLLMCFYYANTIITLIMKHSLETDGNTKKERFLDSHNFWAWVSSQNKHSMFSCQYCMNRP